MEQEKDIKDKYSSLGLFVKRENIRGKLSVCGITYSETLSLSSASAWFFLSFLM